MDNFNKVFQKSTENTTCQLYSEKSRLVRLYASNLLTREAILSVGEDIQNLDLEDRYGQVQDENLGIGSAAWTCLHELETEYDLKPFSVQFKAFM